MRSRVWSLSEEPEDAIGLVVFVCGLLLLLLFSPSSWRRTVVFFCFWVFFWLGSEGQLLMQRVRK